MAKKAQTPGTGVSDFIPDTLGHATIDTKAKVPKPKKGSLGAVNIDYPVESNTKWTFPTSITLINEMRHRDSTISGFMRGLKSPILTTNWDVQGDNKEQVDFIKENLFNRIKWFSFLRTALLHLDYGFYPFEKIYIQDGGQWFLAGLEPRVPETLQEFMYDQTTHQLTGIRQVLSAGGVADIPLEKLVLFINEPENDNPYGTSVLRALYKDYTLKQQAEESKALAVSKNGLGIPVATVDANISPTEEQKVNTDLSRVAKGFIQYFIEKGTTKFRFQGVDGSIPDSDSFLAYLKKNIYDSQNQNLLDMAGTTGTGFQEQLQTAMFANVSVIAKYMAEVIETQVIKPLILINYGAQETYPKLSAPVMFGKNAVALLNSVSQLIATGTVKPTQTLVDFIGRLLELPEGSIEVGTSGTGTTGQPAGKPADPNQPAGKAAGDGIATKKPAGKQPVGSKQPAGTAAGK